MDYGLEFFFFCIQYAVVPTPLLKRLYFIYINPFCTFEENQLITYTGIFLDSVLLHCSISLSLYQYHYVLIIVDL